MPSETAKHSRQEVMLGVYFYIAEKQKETNAEVCKPNTKLSLRYIKLLMYD